MTTLDPKIAVASAFANNAGIISAADAGPAGQSSTAGAFCTAPNDDAVVVTRGQDGSEVAVGFSVIFE